MHPAPVPALVSFSLGTCHYYYNYASSSVIPLEVLLNEEPEAAQTGDRSPPSQEGCGVGPQSEEELRLRTTSL